MKPPRLFFSLWPSPEQIEQLADLQFRFSQPFGRLVDPENFHITLLFLGEIELDRVDCMLSYLDQYEAAPFSCTLDQTGYFSKQQLFWVGPKKVPQELGALHKLLRNNALRCGLSKLSQRYVPHVSLIRKCEGIVADPEFEPIEWQVDEFHLVESTLYNTGAQYRIVDTFPLAMNR